MPSPFIKIRIDTATGRNHHVTKDNNEQPDSSDFPALPSGAEEIAKVYWAASSPGCVYYVQGGKIFRVCDRLP